MLKNKNVQFRFFDKTFKSSTHVYGLHRFKDEDKNERQVVLNNYQAILNALKQYAMSNHINLCIWEMKNGTLALATSAENLSNTPTIHLLSQEDGFCTLELKKQLTFKNK